MDRTTIPVPVLSAVGRLVQFILITGIVLAISSVRLLANSTIPDSTSVDSSWQESKEIPTNIYGEPDFDALRELAISAYIRGDKKSLENYDQRINEDRSISPDTKNSIRFFIEGFIALLNEDCDQAATIFASAYDFFLRNSSPNNFAKVIEYWCLSLEICNRLPEAEALLNRIETELNILPDIPANNKRRFDFYAAALDFYFTNDMFSLAFKYANQALRLAEEVNDSTEITYFSLYSGDIFRVLEVRDLANYYYRYALSTHSSGGEIRDSLDLLRLQIAAISDLDKGSALFRAGERLLDGEEYKDDLFHFRKEFIIWLHSNEYSEAIPPHARKLLENMEANSSLKIGLWFKAFLLEDHLKNQAYSKIISESTVLLSAAKTHNDLELQLVILKPLSNAYTALGKTDSALHHLQQFLLIKDSVQAQNHIKDFLATQIEYQIEKEKETLQKEQEMEQQTLTARIRQQRFLLAGLSIGVVMLSGLLFLYYQNFRIKEQSNAELAKRGEELAFMNEKLQRFTGIISHDILSNLDLMLSAGNILVKPEKPDLGGLHKYYQMTQNTIQEFRLYCLELIKETRTGETTEILPSGEPDKILDRVIQHYSTELERKNFQIIREPLESLRIPSALVLQLFHNVFTNALKYSITHDRQPRIKIGSFQTINNTTGWTFEDNGPGISQETIEQIENGYNQQEALPEPSGSGQGVGLLKLSHQLKLYAARMELGKSKEGGLLLKVSTQL